MRREVGENIHKSYHQTDWVVLNSDGSVLHDIGKAIASGLIRDKYTHCLETYAMNLWSCSITLAKLTRGGGVLKD
ncbi:hypothetical protein LINPERPRIM_LOCUS18753 [Linum perenne]